MRRDFEQTALQHLVDLAGGIRQDGPQRVPASGFGSSDSIQSTRTIGAGAQCLNEVGGRFAVGHRVFANVQDVIGRAANANGVAPVVTRFHIIQCQGVGRNRAFQIIIASSAVDDAETRDGIPGMNGSRIAAICRQNHIVYGCARGTADGTGQGDVARRAQ